MLATPVSSHTGKNSKILDSFNLVHDCRDKAYSKFKPGQTALTRDYYKDATQEKVCGEKALENYNRFKSDYGKNVSGNPKVGDYVVPSQDANTLCKFELN